MTSGLHISSWRTKKSNWANEAHVMAMSQIVLYLTAEKISHFHGTSGMSALTLCLISTPGASLAVNFCVSVSCDSSSSSTLETLPSEGGGIGFFYNY